MNKENISELRGDFQRDRVYGSIIAMGFPARIQGYECNICHFKIYVPLFKSHPNYRSAYGAMVNHVKSHFIMKDMWED